MSTHTASATPVLVTASVTPVLVKPSPTAQPVDTKMPVISLRGIGTLKEEYLQTLGITTIQNLLDYKFNNDTRRSTTWSKFQDKLRDTIKKSSQEVLKTSLSLRDKVSSSRDKSPSSPKGAVGPNGGPLGHSGPRSRSVPHKKLSVGQRIDGEFYKNCANLVDKLVVLKQYKKYFNDKMSAGKSDDFKLISLELQDYIAKYIDS